MEVTTKELLETAEKMSGVVADGHFSIFKFTTHWKVMFGTPNLNDGDGRKEVRALKSFSTLDEALWNLINHGL